MKTTKAIIPILKAFTSWPSPGTRWNDPALEAAAPCCAPPKQVVGATGTRRTGLLLVLCALLVGCGPSLLRGACPSSTCSASTTGPSTLFDLTRWNILLPVEDPNNSGHQLEIQTSCLNTGYEYKNPGASCALNYFYKSSSTMVFAAPWTGYPGTFPNYGKARSELRETQGNNDLDYNFIPGLGGVHILQGTCVVNAAGNGKVIIGQIHAKTPLDSTGSSGAPVPAIILYYDGRAHKADTTTSSDYRKVRVSVYGSVTGTTPTTYTILTGVDAGDQAGVTAGDVLDYEIKMIADASSCNLYVKVNNVTKGGGYKYPNSTLYPIDMYTADHRWSKTAPDSPDGSGNPTVVTDDATRLYFKAGCYYPNRDSVDSPSTAQVTFSSLTMSHGPVITPTATALSYTENSGATALDTGLTLTGADDGKLVSATVTISGNYLSTEDVLGFTTQNGISGSFNSANGVLTLSGQATVPNYQTALRSVTYQNTSHDPNLASRTVTFAASAGTQSSPPTRTITVNRSVTYANQVATGNSGDPTFSPAAALSIDEDGYAVGYGPGHVLDYGYGPPFTGLLYNYAFIWNTAGGNSASRLESANSGCSCTDSEYPFAWNSRANSISGGIVVGWMGYDNGDLPSTWTWIGGAAVPLGGCENWDNMYSEVKAYRDDGEGSGYLVGSTGNGLYARRGTLSAGWEEDPLPGLASSPNTVANSVNLSGEAAGFSKDATYSRKAACYWALDGTLTELVKLSGATQAEALGINDSGWIVGYNILSDSSQRACVWKKVSGSYQVTDLGVLGTSTYSVATAVNGSGRIVGYSGNKACLWINNVAVDLNLRSGTSSYTFVRAYGINDLGQIVGATSWGTEGSPPPFYPPNNTGRAFVLNPE